MSMMDVMNQAGGGGQPPEAAPQGQPGAPQGEQAAMLMGQGSPEEMQELYNKIMTLISTEIWKGNGADQVADQLHQDESQPAEIIGKFTGFYLLMATSSAKAKGGMLPPLLVASVAGETASQLTDIALSQKLIGPDEADDTADAGALIGLEVLLQNSQGMGGEERQEYQDITKAIIEASPTAIQMAEEGAEDAVEDVQEMQGLGDEQNNEGDLVDNSGQQPPQQGGGMAAAMGGA